MVWHESADWVSMFMKIPAVFIFFLLVTGSVVWGQTTASAPEVCTKNVSFAVAEGGQPVPAVPKFAAKLIDKKSHQQEYKTLCFSQIPSSSMNNYLVVFSTSEAMFEGLTPSAHTYTSTTPGSAAATAVSSYGGTWSYSYVGMPPPATTTTLDLRRDDKPKSLFVRAYNQQGRLISKYSLGGFFSKEKLVDYVLANILGDAPLPQRQKPMAVPLSVYYVNCDVDSPAVETAKEAPPDTAPPGAAGKDSVPKNPAPKAVLDIWSNPAGADISLDGEHIGKTPYSMVVPPGEHMIALHKPEFGTWQRKMQMDAGEHRVGAYLEQKTLALEFPPNPTAAAPAPAPAGHDSGSAVLDFWSSPTGADILLDGTYVGKTPYSLAVSPGEHTITLRKKDFGTWQGKVQAAAGKRKVGGNLQQKSITLQ